VLSGLGAAAGAAVYGSCYERHHPVLERITVRLPGLGSGFAGFTIAHISDLHVDSTRGTQVLADAVSLIMGLRPDLIVLTGDFVTHETKGLDLRLAPLAGLSAAAGVYSSPGNHDLWSGISKVVTAIENQGITHLQNRGITLSRGGDQLNLLGLDSAWAGRPDFAKANKPLVRVAPSVVLMHEPDYADTLAVFGAPKLQLAGHTHGGQICIPGGFPIRLPKWGQCYARGHYRVGNTQLYVNRGMGTISPHMRIASSPEVTLVTLA
jgi:uncharacterized protein